MTTIPLLTTLCNAFQGSWRVDHPKQTCHRVHREEGGKRVIAPAPSILEGFDNKVLNKVSAIFREGGVQVQVFLSLSWQQFAMSIFSSHSHCGKISLRFLEKILISRRSEKSHAPAPIRRSSFNAMLLFEEPPSTHNSALHCKYVGWNLSQIDGSHFTK